MQDEVQAFDEMSVANKIAAFLRGRELPAAEIGRVLRLRPGQVSPVLWRETRKRNQRICVVRWLAYNEFGAHKAIYALGTKNAPKPEGDAPDLIAEFLKTEGPTTGRDLASFLMLPSGTISSSLSRLRKGPRHCVYIKKWIKTEEQRHHNYSAVFAYGSEPDVPRPKRAPRAVVNRRSYEKKKAKLDAMSAAHAKTERQKRYRAQGQEEARKKAKRGQDQSRD